MYKIVDSDWQRINFTPWIIKPVPGTMELCNGRYNLTSSVHRFYVHMVYHRFWLASYECLNIHMDQLFWNQT